MSKISSLINMIISSIIYPFKKSEFKNRNIWLIGGHAGDIYDDNSMYKGFVGFAEDNEDAQFLKSLYPAEVMVLQLLVEDALDKLEYDGSIMFDQYPDKVRILRLVDGIEGSDDKDRRAMLEVLLINEMLRRRMRRRYCRARGFC